MLSPPSRGREKTASSFPTTTPDNNDLGFVPVGDKVEEYCCVPKTSNGTEGDGAVPGGRVRVAADKGVAVPRIRRASSAVDTESSESAGRTVVPPADVVMRRAVVEARLGQRASSLAESSLSSPASSNLTRRRRLVVRLTDSRRRLLPVRDSSDESKDAMVVSHESEMYGCSFRPLSSLCTKIMTHPFTLSLMGKAMARSVRSTLRSRRFEDRSMIPLFSHSCAALLTPHPTKE